MLRAFSSIWFKSISSSKTINWIHGNFHTCYHVRDVIWCGGLWWWRWRRWQCYCQQEMLRRLNHPVLFFHFVIFFFCENRWNTRVLSNGKHSKLKRLQTMAEQFIHIYYRRMKFRIFLHLTVVSRQPNHYTYVQSRWTIAKKEGSLKSLTSLRTHTLAYI